MKQLSRNGPSRDYHGRALIGHGQLFYLKPSALQGCFNFSPHSLSCFQPPCPGIISSGKINTLCLGLRDLPLNLRTIPLAHFSMYLSAPKLSSFDLARSASCYPPISSPDLTAPSSFALAGPLASATAASVPYSLLSASSFNDVIWVAVRRPS